MNFYRDWQLFEEIPEGWKVDKSAGSPLAGYVFITNGKSIFNGQKRALKLAREKNQLLFIDDQKQIILEPVQDKPKPIQIIDGAYCKTVNDLARAQFKRKMLSDILVDLQICEIEGWSKREYILQLQDMLNGYFKCSGSTISSLETVEIGRVSQ